MKKTPIHKKVAVFAIALALSVTAFGGFSYQTAHAESDSSRSAISSLSQESLASLLQDLIHLLQLRLQELLDARDAGTNSSSKDTVSCTSDTSGLTELEAEVFTNETLIKVELDGVRYVFTTDVTTRSEIADAVRGEFTDLTDSEVADALVISREDRASRASDKDWADKGSSLCDDSSVSSTHNSSDDDSDEDEDHRGGSDDDSDDDHGSNHGHGGDDD